MIRSIPALTGKPNRTRNIPARRWVYPRAYGETLHLRLHLFAQRGLSPRLRGNRAGGGAVGAGDGSIPALTGKPIAYKFPTPSSGVYPRAYGETSRCCGIRSPPCGLSPRLRGNPVHGPRMTRRFGSIPALTGKPRIAAICADTRRVYPRAYGETRPASANGPRARGLSPRLRGNPHVLGAGRQLRRSIPALTGKPFLPTGGGGAAAGGLSPRLRGNRRQGHRQPPARGSIPALTGKPSSCRDASRPGEVYPRAYGETCLRGLRVENEKGLSPRLRGNPFRVS